MLQKAKVDLKPLLSSLSANKEKLRESSKSSPPRLGAPGANVGVGAGLWFSATKDHGFLARLV